MTLSDQEWTEEQARGLLDSLNLDGGTPKWKLEPLRRLCDWCSAHGKDPAIIDCQLEFVAHELCDGFQAVGMALKRAKTVNEARELVRPYVRRLTAPEIEGQTNNADAHSLYVLVSSLVATLISLPAVWYFTAAYASSGLTA